MAINTKVQICNMALSHLGNYGTINDIDTPVTDKEKTFSLWYDITRQAFLRNNMPNFALERRLLAAASLTIPFGYDAAYLYPSDCLKILGLGNVDEKADYKYAVESVDGQPVIYTDDTWTGGLQIRFIKDVEDISVFTPDAKVLLSWELAANVVLDITQNEQKSQLIQQILPMKRIEFSGVSAQENRPIRVSKSLFEQARLTDISRNPSRK